MVQEPGQEMEKGENLFPSFVLGDNLPTIPPPQTPVRTKDGKKTGSIYSGCQNVGMAMVRLEHLESDIERTELVVELSDGQTVLLKVMQPCWWPKYIQERMEREKMIANQFAEPIEDK